MSVCIIHTKILIWKKESFVHKVFEQQNET